MQRTAGRLGSALSMKFYPQPAATRHPGSRLSLSSLDYWLFGSPRQAPTHFILVLRSPNAFRVAKAEASSQDAPTDEFTSFRIACRERDFRAFCHWPCGASGQTSAGNGRNLPDTDVGERGRAYHRCHLEYLDVATLLRSGLNRKGF